MPKRKPLQKSDPVGTLESQLNQDFNGLIREIHRSLSTKKHSPVWTGFFASSWKVQTSAVKAVDKVEDFNPWKTIKRQKSEEFFKGWRDKRQIASTKPANPKIQPRFPVEKTFNIKRPVWIGNRAKYAAYALEGGKIQNFIQGRLGQLIKKNMQERKGRLFIASRKTAGFGSSRGDVGYSEINLKKDYQ